MTKGLAIPRPVFCRVLCVFLPPGETGIQDSHTLRAWQVRLSTLRYSRAKLAVMRHANLRFASRIAFFLQLSKIAVPLIYFRSERLRSRRSAVSVWSRSHEKNLRTIKNPASSAGRFRPSPGPRFPRASRTEWLEARLFLPGVRNQPHLISVGRPGPSADSPADQGSTNINTV